MIKLKIVNSPGKTSCDSLCTSHQNSGQHVSLSKQIVNFFSKLLDSKDWPPRWHCGTWSDFHGWLYIVSDIAIGTAYFAIPFLLFRMLNKRKDIPFPGIVWLFIAFILFCGTTHFIDAAIFWWPLYRLSALVRFITAVVSIITIIALYRILPGIYQLRTAQQLEAEIEERKKAEQEVRHHQIMQEAAKDLMDKKDEFMSIASHELKTPITSLKLHLQLLEKMVKPEEIYHTMIPFVEKANKQVSKLETIVSDLLDVTLINAGKLELHKTTFNIFHLVKECVEQCQPADKQHEITIDGDPETVVFADKKRIDQVLCNFITNAVKYSPLKGTINITIAAIGNEKTRISITDHGIGIPEDKQSRLFDRYYRVENTSRHVSGVGLGLYISSEIIKQHKGEIGLSSIVGKGSVFWFVI